MSESFLDGKVTLLRGDCLELLPTLEEGSIDSCVTDPPYHLTSIVKRYSKGDAKTENSIKLHGTQKVSPYMRGAKGFMGKEWDGGDIAFTSELWTAVLRVLKPGAHLLAFSGTRTYHRMACAIEDAGFEIRDQLGFAYGSGFPKSHNVSRNLGDARCACARPEATSILLQHDMRTVRHADGVRASYRPQATEQSPDKLGTVALQSEPQVSGAWPVCIGCGKPIIPDGLGSALKPAWEPIVLARKPLSESSIAQNVLKHGTGAINIDACRIETGESLNGGAYIGELRQREERTSTDTVDGAVPLSRLNRGAGEFKQPLGRWPANLIHDGSEEVVRGFPETQSGTLTPDMNVKACGGWSGGSQADRVKSEFHSNSGSAARFFYTAKADADDRLGSKHPTVKPLDLIQYLVRLVTPKGGVVLDPFGGTGTAGEAAFREGFRAILIEREPEYQADIVKRMGLCLSGPDERRAASVKQESLKGTPLFGGLT
jgi:DNA modification methylase